MSNPTKKTTGMNRLNASLLNFASTEKEIAIIGERTKTTSNREAAESLGIPRRTVDRTVNRIIERAEALGVPIQAEIPKILFIDIETAPALSYLWSMWPKGGINPEMQVERTYILGYCAKWMGDSEVITATKNDENMLDDLWHLLDASDFVCAHNGDRFDVKRVNSELLLADYSPPSPYRQIDTLKMVKRTFGFDSNRLDYLCRVLLGEGKEKHDGFATWVGCMQDDPKAWETMMHYCRKDVLLLERLYMKLRAWDKSHPNVLLSMETVPQAPACTVCGSYNVAPITDKVSATNASRFAVFECMDCGTTLRSSHSMATTPLRKAR